MATLTCLTIFEHRALRFHFALGSRNFAVAPGTGLGVRRVQSLHCMWCCGCAGLTAQTLPGLFALPGGAGVDYLCQSTDPRLSFTSFPHISQLEYLGGSAWVSYSNFVSCLWKGIGHIDLSSNQPIV